MAMWASAIIQFTAPPTTIRTANSNYSKPKERTASNSPIPIVGMFSENAPIGIITSPTTNIARKIRIFFFGDNFISSPQLNM